MAAPIQVPTKARCGPTYGLHLMYLYFPDTPRILGHAPYSPDLAPSDFHLFLHLKKHLAGESSTTMMRCKKKL
jgi:hypothetical protein